MKSTSIVTGASRGIGRAIATELARTHDIIGTYRGRRDAAESLQAETGASIFQCDVSSAADREGLRAAVFALREFSAGKVFLGGHSYGGRQASMLAASDPEASEGLLLLTNDGEFANALTSASNHIPKTYLVKTNGLLTSEQEEQFRRGVPMEGRMTAPAGLKLIRKAVNPWYEVRLTEGRKNQIRIMFKHFGRLVEKLKRVRIGFLELGPIKPGEFRQLSPEEVERFRKLIKRSANGRE